MNKRICVEECDGKTIVRGEGIHMVIEGDKMTLDTSLSLRLRGNAIKKLNDLPGRITTIVCEALDTITYKHSG